MNVLVLVNVHVPETAVMLAEGIAWSVCQISIIVMTNPSAVRWASSFS